MERDVEMSVSPVKQTFRTFLIATNRSSEAKHWRTSTMGANPGGTTGAIASPRVCQNGLNIAQALSSK